MPGSFVAKDPLDDLNPGELRHQIALAHVSTSQDQTGQPVNTWTAYRTTMASIRMLTGKEQYQGQEFTSGAQWLIRTRWTDDNTVPGDRVTWLGHTYVVQIVNNVLGRMRVLELTCLEIDGAS